MSFTGPGRDDSNLPPVNIVIPDDARELDRDVLAYRRELRANRRRERLQRLVRPFRIPEFGTRAAIVPLIAACLAISLVGGALLSVATMTTASAPTLSDPRASAQPATSSESTGPSAGLGELPAGTVQVSGHAVPVRSLVVSTIAIIPASCGCGTALSRLATEAVAAHVRLYFAGAAISQLRSLTARYGDGAAVAAVDDDGVLSAAYHPVDLTVLLVFEDATVEVVRNPTGNFELALSDLKLPGDSSSGGS